MRKLRLNQYKWWTAWNRFGVTFLWLALFFFWWFFIFSLWWIIHWPFSLLFRLFRLSLYVYIFVFFISLINIKYKNKHKNWVKQLCFNHTISKSQIDQTIANRIIGKCSQRIQFNASLFSQLLCFHKLPQLWDIDE